MCNKTITIGIHNNIMFAERTRRVVECGRKDEALRYEARLFSI